MRLEYVSIDSSMNPNISNPLGQVQEDIILYQMIFFFPVWSNLLCEKILLLSSASKITSLQSLGTFSTWNFLVPWYKVKKCFMKNILKVNIAIQQSKDNPLLLDDHRSNIRCSVYSFKIVRVRNWFGLMF